MESWKEELDHKYEKLTNTGNNRIIDKANEIILQAIEKLDALRKEFITD